MLLLEKIVVLSVYFASREDNCFKGEVGVIDMTYDLN